MGRSLRRELFTSDEVCIVHVVQRCVRRVRLAGKDHESGKDYSHRKEWIQVKLEALASAFGIDVLGFSILSNHIHAILRNRPDVVASWSDKEVATRWLKIYPGKRLYENPLGQPTEEQVEALCKQPEKIAKIREGLADISRFMGVLAEHVARRANREDDVTGRFWEGRFKAQRILDEAGLLACAIYVDLNPIRAAIAKQIDDPQNASCHERLHGERGEMVPSHAFPEGCTTAKESGEQIRKSRKSQKRRRHQLIRRGAWLAPIQLRKNQLDNSGPCPCPTGLRASNKGWLHLSLDDYLSLLRWISGERPVDNDTQPPRNATALIKKLGLHPERWKTLIRNFSAYFRSSSFIGAPESMAAAARKNGRSWARGQTLVGECFAPN